ncbi:hypothetical protein K1719_015820 [Acacia pycnantha]|nr:hypothetical protein K1719_015820 [Acacia pycnantha]
MERQREQDSEAAISSKVVEFGSNRIAPATNVDDAFSTHKKPRWGDFLSYIGPGFLVSMAYLDPGNLETDLQAGANHGFELLWVILIGLLFALIIQSLAANLGVTTGKHLSELCKVEYPSLVKYCLWLLAEISVIAADIAEVVGTAFALNILFHIPLWAGVLLTGFSTLLLLGLQRFGVRKLELLISILVFIMGGCFFVEMGYVKPSASGVLKGMFVPKLSGDGATADAIALFGALIMPYYSFSSFTPCLDGEKNAKRCDDLSLDSASYLLKNVLGKSNSTVYAIALLASGQSSTITGTYAGQYIMQGFLELRMKKWMRNLMTRSVAIIPSLVVVVISGPSGASRLIIISSPPKSGKRIHWDHSIPLMAIYVAAIIYLTFRKDTVKTFIDTQNDSQVPAHMELGPNAFREDLRDIQLPL